MNVSWFVDAYRRNGILQRGMTTGNKAECSKRHEIGVPPRVVSVWSPNQELLIWPSARKLIRQFVVSWKSSRSLNLLFVRSETIPEHRKRQSVRNKG
jgi:hypothetical protein